MESIPWDNKAKTLIVACALCLGWIMYSPEGPKEIKS